VDALQCEFDEVSFARWVRDHAGWVAAQAVPIKPIGPGLRPRPSADPHQREEVTQWREF
jgi:hypothetical protein